MRGLDEAAIDPGLTDHEVLALCKIYDEVCNHHLSMPTYEQVAIACGVTAPTAKRIVMRLNERGLLDGRPGRKPTRLTRDGEMIAARLFVEVESGRREVEQPAQLPVSGSQAPKQELSLLGTMSRRLSLKPDALMEIIKRQVISLGKNEEVESITNEEVALVLHTMHKYDLDPMMKQVYAFRSRGKLQVIVGYDGWVKIANEKIPGYKGCDYTYGPDIEVPGTNRKAPEWIQGRMVSEGRMDTSFRVYLNEWCDLRSENWMGKPAHRLRIKCFSLHAREHGGISAMDEIDGENIARQDYHDMGDKMAESAKEKRQSLSERLNAARDRAQEAEFEEVDEPAECNGRTVAGEPDDLTEPNKALASEDCAPHEADEESQAEDVAQLEQRAANQDEVDLPPDLDDDPGPQAAGNLFSDPSDARAKVQEEIRKRVEGRP